LGAAGDRLPVGGGAGQAGAYDRLAYPGFAYAATHPARLEAIGRLFGVDAPPAASCRVLELGCGDGGNALSIAQTLPGARVLGVDAAAGAVGRGTALARAAGLSNVRLRRARFEELGEGGEGLDLGESSGTAGTPGGNEPAVFDYIVAHGVYSWVPPDARGALLDCMKRCLAPRGIAFVSYNAYPGSYLRDMARDILGYHVRDIEDPERKLAAAQELMQTIVAIEEPSPFARVLREHMERMLGYSDALLFHDDLAEVSTPFYFHEFVEHANRHGLQFLSEADLPESQMRDLPDSAGRLIATLPGDAVVREQYLDFFKNRMFRQTLLCHAELALSHALEDRAIERLWISSQARADEGVSDLGEGEGRTGGETDSGGDVAQGDGPEVQRVEHRGEPAAQETDGGDEPAVGVTGGGGEPVAGQVRNGGESPPLVEETFVTPEGFTVTTSEPLVRAAMRVLADAWPGAVSFEELLDLSVAALDRDAAVDAAAARLRDVLLRAYLARIVLLGGCSPLLSSRPCERPLASPLARAQLAAGMPALSSLLHANVRLEGALEPRLLPLLDGTRTLSELAQALDATAEQANESLLRLASLGLLAA
jgi:SAM-dependent methyltransferase